MAANVEKTNKYDIIRDHHITFNGRRLYRIIANKDFGIVKKGTLGGFIESKENLNENDLSWIDKNSKLLYGARVSGKSFLIDTIVENAEVSNVTFLYWCNDPIVSSKCKKINDTLTRNVKYTPDEYLYEKNNMNYIGECSNLHDVIMNYTNNAIRITDSDVTSCQLTGADINKSIVVDSSINNSKVIGSNIYNNVFVSNSIIQDVVIDRCTKIINGAIGCTVFYTKGSQGMMTNAEIPHYLIIGPIGSRNDFTTFYPGTTKGEIIAHTGCFTNTIDEFKKSVSTTYGVGYIDPKRFPIHALYYNQYMKAIEYAKQYFDYIKELTQ